MCGTVHRSCVRAGIHQKHEDEWRLNNEKKRSDRATAADMGPFDASLC